MYHRFFRQKFSWGDFGKMEPHLAPVYALAKFKVWCMLMNPNLFILRTTFIIHSLPMGPMFENFANQIASNDE